MTDWLEEHLETFVKPHLGSIPDAGKPNQDWIGHEYAYLGGEAACLTPEILRELKSSWITGKALSKGKPILFPGRDAWLLHVMANMEGYPTLFRPELSRSVAQSGIIDKTQFTGCFLVDCGSRGTIPNALGIEDYALTSAYEKKHSLRPNAGVGEHSVAYTFMTYHAKYWVHAEPVGGAVKQDRTEAWEFERCCQLTQHFVEVACAPRKKTMVLITRQEAL